MAKKESETFRKFLRTLSYDDLEKLLKVLDAKIDDWRELLTKEMERRSMIRELVTKEMERR